MQRSRGFRSKTRNKLTSVKRPGRSNLITKKLQKFEENDLVHIIIDPSVHKGQPHPRFHGKTGKIIGVQGKSYVLGLNDKNKAKELIVRPEHLKLQSE
ncbi:MAG: 50S ribosomal protein L21e [Methanobrevibacter sp.]|nr:50S ribosomal protein L21e [Candidatus Methanoflexus mossambicus]